jgi:hypothetical protein
MRNDRRARSLSGLAALLVFAVFAAGILAVLLDGAGAYRRLTQRDSRTCDSRTCAQYMATKLRQAPGPDAVELSAFGDGDALVIHQDIKGTDFVTRVYCYDGWLMELFTVADGDFSPADGEQLLPISRLSLAREGQLISVDITDDSGEAIRLTLALRGGEGAQT